MGRGGKNEEACKCQRGQKERTGWWEGEGEGPVCGMWVERGVCMYVQYVASLQEGIQQALTKKRI